MVQLTCISGSLLAAAALVQAIPAPLPTPAPDLSNRAGLEKRATCTFTEASAASVSKTSCATIVLDNIAVPSGVTLDLSGLTSGTHVSNLLSNSSRELRETSQVIFEGETTWAYEEWSGPLVTIGGEDIVVTGSAGNSLNGQGALWWDGLGGNGGVTKPKMFAAHDLTGTSSITGLNILNSPKSVFSIDGASGLTLADITIDDSAGDVDALGHNTDAFDVGGSTNVLITGANVKNQDDCLAVNSGSVSFALY